MQPVALWRFVFVVLVAMALVACRGQATPLASDVTPAEVGGANVEAPTPAEPVPQIASGTMPTIKELPTPTPLPTSIAERHVVTLEKALEAVTFPLFEPRDLPEKSYRDAIQLEQPREGETAPGLPLVRFIYSIEPRGAIIMTQRPADGSEGTGEVVEIGAARGWLTETETAVIVEWEQEGTRLQVRGNGLDRETVLAAARSMVRIQP